jgi:Holliday junction resolvase
MAAFTVRQGKRYRATITLNVLERLAGNDTIAERLRSAGFAEVRIAGSGAKRSAEALWPGPDTTAEMPAQITEVIEI